MVNPQSLCLIPHRWDRITSDKSGLPRLKSNVQGQLEPCEALLYHVISCSSHCESQTSAREMYRPLKQHHRRRGPVVAERVWSADAGAFINIHAPAQRQKASHKGPKIGPSGMRHIYNIRAQAPQASSSGTITPTDSAPDLFHTSHLYTSFNPTPDPDELQYDSTRDSLEDRQPTQVQEQDDDDFLPDIGDLRLTGVRLNLPIATLVQLTILFPCLEPTGR